MLFFLCDTSACPVGARNISLAVVDAARGKCPGHAEAPIRARRVMRRWMASFGDLFGKDWASIVLAREMTKIAAAFARSRRA